MPRLGPIHRRGLIRYLRQLGFSGPYPGSNHQYMRRGRRKIYIPNPHGGNISRGFLARIIRQAGITLQEWERL